MGWGLFEALDGRYRIVAGTIFLDVYTDHAKYPNIADLTGKFVYARLQRGKDRNKY